MATYYVRPDGNNSNAGTGPAANQAWQTLARIVQAGTAFTSGDTVYIAPGTYRQSITTTATYTSPTYFTGDPTASQFPGVTPGIVRITNFLTNDNSAATNQLLWGGVTFDYINISNIYFDHSSLNGGIYYTGTGNNSSIRNCVFSGNSAAGAGVGTPSIRLTSVKNTLIENCIVMRSYLGALITTTSDTDTNVDIRNCTIAGTNDYGLFIGQTTGGGINVTNNLFHFTRGTAVFFSGAGNATAISYVTNNIFYSCVGSVGGSSSVNIIENYNRRVNSGGNSTVLTGAFTVTDGAPQFDFGHSSLFGLAVQKPFSSITGSVNVGAGLSTYASTTDLYGQTWSAGASLPDIGCAAAVQASGTSYYYPTERNASTITIAPGSTSQSIELYLGATGLTASTSGLSAYYNRTRSADVQIPLVARNITQNWTSGGFAEVNPNTMPGVYRLDIPNEALAAGADDVTVVVRGASGTNGAVVSIKLSSGGLTTAQTASAVWGALTNDHTTHGTYGWNVLRADQDSKEGLVTLHQSGGISRVDADIHAIANDTAAATALKGALNHDGTGYVDSDVVRISTSTAAANELEGALLHNGTDYIDSNLLSGNSTQVFVGRFQLTQTGTTQGDIIEAFTTDTPSFELQLFDGDNNIVPVTGATLGLRILDVTSTVVETGTPTIEYGTGGIVRWTAPGSYVSIGCPAGMYRLFVDRTVSGTTTTFGPLQIKVQVQ